MEPSTNYDVIIVGGRPAGATLAIRLGHQGLRVLLLERAVFPCPHPASSPIIYGSSMALLDEIGANEADYARGTPRIRNWVNEMYDRFRVSVPFPDAFGRNYGYALDRARFDAALWRLASSTPNVTALQPFAVQNLLWRDGVVVGVTGQTHSGQESFTAGCVVGADGRFSTVAQKVAAQTYHVRNETPTTVYYAAWEDAEPCSDQEAVIHFCKPDEGFFFFLFDTADGLVNVCIEGQSKLFSPGPGQVEIFYMDMLRRYPLIWRRLARAKRVTPVHGMRNIRNLYRTAGGPGWMLVGDALHQKDPIDGQGIYDALFTAKTLSKELASWKLNDKPWAQAITDYNTAVQAETYEMYNVTLNQVKLNVYSNQSADVNKFLYRWFGADEELNRRYALLSVRAIPPTGWLPTTTLLNAASRGLLENIRCFLARQPHPAEIC